MTQLRRTEELDAQTAIILAMAFTELRVRFLKLPTGLFLCALSFLPSTLHTAVRCIFLR